MKLLQALPIVFITLLFVVLCCAGIYANLKREQERKQPRIVVQRDYRVRDKVACN